MHPFNGLQLDEWAKERYAHSLSEAQRELSARRVGRRQSNNLFQWLQLRLTGWRQPPQPKTRYRTEP